MEDKIKDYLNNKAKNKEPLDLGKGSLYGDYFLKGSIISPIKKKYVFKSKGLFPEVENFSYDNNLVNINLILKIDIKDMNDAVKIMDEINLIINFLFKEIIFYIFSYNTSIKNNTSREIEKIKPVKVKNGLYSFSLDKIDLINKKAFINITGQGYLG